MPFGPVVAEQMADPVAAEQFSHALGQLYVAAGRAAALLVRANSASYVT